MNLIDFSVEKSTDAGKSRYIQQLIKSAARLNSDFLSKWKKYKITSELDFDPDWGLGSSSTLIANLAEWSELSPFELFFDTQEGSGYDVAAAVSDAPLLYQKSDDELSFETFDWDQDLLDSIVVFYQGQKQSSHMEVRAWKNNNRWNRKDVDRMTLISESLAECHQIEEAIHLIKENREMVEKLLDQKAFDGLYSDFEGAIKPLGAWGGDFGGALSKDVEYTRKYLRDKGLENSFRLSDIVVTFASTKQ